MARFNGQSGSTHYVVFDNGAATPLIWNALTAAFEAYSAANWVATKYCVAATEIGAGMFYVADPAGAVNATAFQQAGASPATTDAKAAAGETATVASRVATAAVPAVTLAAGQTVASTGLVTGAVTLAAGQTVASAGSVTSIPAVTLAAGQTVSSAGSVSSIPAVTLASGQTVASAGTVTSALTLTSAYDAAKTAASQTTADAIQAKTGNLPDVPMVNTAGKLWVLDGDGNPVASEANATANKDEILAANPGTGDGDVLVNHNYGGTDALQVKASGVGVDGASIRAYLAANYDAGTYDVDAQTITGSDGRWIAPLMLDADDYVLVISKPGSIATKVFRITVS